MFLNSSLDSCYDLQFCPQIVSFNISFDSFIRHKLPIHKTSFCYWHANCDSFRDFLQSEIFLLKIVLLKFLPVWKLVSRPLCLLVNARYNHNLSLVHAYLFSNYSLQEFLFLVNQCSDYDICLFVSSHNKCKCVPKEAKLLFADRIRQHIASHKFSSWGYSQLCKNLLNKLKSSINLKC